MEDYLWIATSNKLPQLHSTVTVVPKKKCVSSFMLKLTLRRSRCGSEVRLKTPPQFYGKQTFKLHSLSPVSWHFPAQQVFVWGTIFEYHFLLYKTAPDLILITAHVWH
jgi:hypothetical protein